MNTNLLHCDLDRRHFLGTLAVGGAAVGVAFAGVNSPGILDMTTTQSVGISLPALPYAQDALQPHISAQTFSFHYGKHHKAYVDKLNELIAGTALAKSSLEEIVRASAADSTKAGMFNQSAQVWNHSFFWNSMKPNGGGLPSGKLLEKINADFGTVDKLKADLVDAGMTQFGSGWAWLVNDGGKLKVVKTANAGTPLTEGKTPLLTIDVWEHAYYLDYQNRRKDFLTTVLDKLINWDFAAANLG